MELPTATSMTYGSYTTLDGRRDVVIVRYDESSYAVFDERHDPDGEDRDERCIEDELLTDAEAEAVAADYLDNARVVARPLVRAS